MSLRFSGNHQHEEEEVEEEDVEKKQESSEAGDHARWTGEGVGVSCDWCFAQLYSSLAPPPPRGADLPSWYRCWQCTPPITFII
jgi:hypothetical protein